MGDSVKKTANIYAGMNLLPAFLHANELRGRSITST